MSFSLAVGTGPGAEERRAVPVVVIGGQTLCLLLTLLVAPVACALLDDLRQKLHWRTVLKRANGMAAQPAPIPGK